MLSMDHQLDSLEKKSPNLQSGRCTSSLLKTSFSFVLTPDSQLLTKVDTELHPLSSKVDTADSRGDMVKVSHLQK